MCPRKLSPTVAAALAVAVVATPLLAAPAPTRADARLRAGAVDTQETPTAVHPASLRKVAAETRYWTRLSSMMSSGDRRKVAAAHTRFELQSAFFNDPLRDPFYDRSRNAVRDGYLKLYKEMFKRQFVDDFVEETLTSRYSGEIGDGDSPWKLRLSPRVALGNSGYVGLSVRLPNARVRGLDHMSLRVRQGTDDDELAVGLRYSHGRRYWQLERVTGDPTTGDRMSGTVVLRF